MSKKQLKPKHKMNARKNLAIWGEPNSTLQSQFGNVTYRRWCELESERMNNNGGSTEVVEHEENGLIAIARK